MPKHNNGFVMVQTLLQGHDYAGAGRCAAQVLSTPNSVHILHHDDLDDDDDDRDNYGVNNDDDDDDDGDDCESPQWSTFSVLLWRC